MSDLTLEGWTDLGPAGTVADGESHGFSVDGFRICVVHYEGQFFALPDRCTHGHAYLSRGICDVKNYVLECPLHGGLFDFRTGAAVGVPANKDTPVLETKVDGERLFVRVPGGAA